MKCSICLAMRLKIILVPSMDWRYTGVIYLYFITLNSTDTSSTVRSWLSMVRCLEIGFHAQPAYDLSYLRCRPTIVTYFNCSLLFNSTGHSSYSKILLTIAMWLRIWRIFNFQVGWSLRLLDDFFVSCGEFSESLWYFRTYLYFNRTT